MQRSVITPRGEITFELSCKRVKNINLRVGRDGRVRVSAPPSAALDFIDGFVCSRAAFIADAIERAKKRADASPTHEYLSGEEITVLGRRLTITLLEGERDRVYTEGDRLILTSRYKLDRDGRERLIRKWLDSGLRLTVREITDRYYPAFAERGIAYPEIKIRNMRSRWGSCHTKKHIITFSSALIAAPVAAIEYVVMHELAHFIHPNHSPAFHSEMTKLMPDWRARKEILKGVAV